MTEEKSGAKPVRKRRSKKYDPNTVVDPCEDFCPYYKKAENDCECKCLFKNLSAEYERSEAKVKALVMSAAYLQEIHRPLKAVVNTLDVIEREKEIPNG